MKYEEAIKVLRFVLDPREYPNGEKSKCYQYNLGAINKAIEALEKQIPKKPPNHDRMVCPSCNSKARYGHPYEYYCPHCGQALDWEDDE